MARFGERLRKAAGSLVANGFFHGAAAAGRLHPMARPDRHRVEVTRDVRVTAGLRSCQTCSVYAPGGTSEMTKLPSLAGCVNRRPLITCTKATMRGWMLQNTRTSPGCANV